MAGKVETLSGELKIQIGLPRLRQLIESCRRVPLRCLPGGLNGGNVDFLHGHHRLERSLGFIAPGA